MGLFLHAALPALRHHYARFPPGTPVTPLVTLLELAGWAVTCDPSAQPPSSLLRELLERAAAERMHAQLRVSAQQLPEVGVVWGLGQGREGEEGGGRNARRESRHAAAARESLGARRGEKVKVKGIRPEAWSKETLPVGLGVQGLVGFSRGQERGTR